MSLDRHVCNRLVCCTQTVHKEFSEVSLDISREADLLFGASFFSYGDIEVLLRDFNHCLIRFGSQISHIQRILKSFILRL